MIRFPYLRIGNDSYPVIPIRLHGPDGGILTRALVDSGARISLFQADLAQAIGVNVESGEPIYLEGIGGRILGYTHTLTCGTDGHTFTGRIAFSGELLISFNLPGRQGFFENFAVIFDESGQEIRLLAE